MTPEVTYGAQGITYAAAGASVAFWGLNLTDFAVITSSVIAVLSFLVHLNSSVAKERRAREWHAVQMELLRDDPTPYLQDTHTE